MRVSRAAVAVRVATVGLWLLVLSGPVLGAAALLSQESAPGAARQERGEVEQPDQGLELVVGEFGVRFVSAWLAASSESDGAGLERYVAVVPGLPESPVVRRAGDLRVADAIEVEPGLWSVTVAGEVELALSGSGSAASGEWWGPVTKFWRVGVRADRADTREPLVGAPSLVATSLPAEVAGPARAADVESVFGPAVDGAPGALGEAAGSFLALYLSGDSDLRRYVTPGSDLTALPDTGVAEAEVVAMAAATPKHEPVDLVELASGGMPRDGARVQVLVTVLPRTDAGELPVQQYVLAAEVRAGRWEIAGLEPAVRSASTSESDESGESGDGVEGR